MIELRLLGTVELQRDGGGRIQSVAVQPKRLALLCYLAIARPVGPHRRDTLLGLFWPELDTERARAALSKALHHLRSSLGADAIVSRGEEAVELDRGRVGSDVARFEDALRRDQPDRALELYGGDLLHGFFLSDAPEFERWLDGERLRLRTLAAAAAGSLADRFEAAGDPASAATWARRALELAGSDERALRRLMSVLDAGGDRSGALTAFEQFAAGMHAELGIAPAPETRALADIIRLRDTAHAAPAAPPRVVPVAAADYPATAPAPPPAPVRPRRRHMVAAALVLVSVLAAGALAYRLVSRPETELHPRRVLVLPFDNRTLDAGLDPVGRMAADWVVDGISRMGGFEVVPSASLWAVPGAEDADAGDAEPVRRLARETGAGTVLSGSYYLDGGRLYLHARVHDAATGRVLRPVGGVAVSTDSVLDGVDRLRTRILAAIAPVGDTVYHLAAATPPPTYEAYREYVSGMGAFVTGDPALALRHYLRAAAADSAWAMPRIAAAIMHLNLGNVLQADSLVAPLKDARERLGPLERGTVDMVLGLMAGDHPLAAAAVAGLARLAPGTINEYMVAELARRMNRPADAVAVLDRMGPERRELRGWQAYWREAAWSRHLLGRHREELAEARRARALYPQSPLILGLEVRAHAALGHAAEVRERIAERAAMPAGSDYSAGTLLTIAARELAAHGHAEEAADMGRRAAAWYEEAGAEARRAPPHAEEHASALLAADRVREAADLLHALHRERPGDPRVTARLGLALAKLGDRAAATALSAEAAAYRSPTGRSGPINVMAGEHTRIRAAIAAQLGDAAAASALLRQAEAEGLPFSPGTLCDPDLAPLAGQRAYEEWRAPRAGPRAGKS